MSDLYQSRLGDDLQDFLHLLLRLLDTDYSVQDWFSDQLVNKLRRDIFSPGMDSLELEWWIDFLNLSPHNQRCCAPAGRRSVESEVLLYWDKESVRKAFPAVLLSAQDHGRAEIRLRPTL